MQRALKYAALTPLLMVAACLALGQPAPAQLGHERLIVPPAREAQAVPADVVLPEELPDVAGPRPIVPPKVLRSKVLPAPAVPLPAVPDHVLPAEAVPPAPVPAKVLPAKVLPARILPAKVLRSKVQPAKPEASEAEASEAAPSEAQPAPVLPAEAVPLPAVLEEAVLAPVAPADTPKARDKQPGPEPSAAQQPDAERARLEEEFAKSLSGATLVGYYTTTGKEQQDGLQAEKYRLGTVKKLNDQDLWLFEYRYGDSDRVIPLPLVVKWAGDTPVITLTDLTIPGVGTFTARVLFYRGEYAGTWSAGDHGGQLFGRVEQQKPQPQEN